MFETQDDAIAWANYSPAPHPAESQRMAELIPDPVRAAAYLDFGLRPYGLMDDNLYDQPKGLDAPWAPEAGDLSAEPLVVDIATGWRFQVDSKTTSLVLDLNKSENFLEAQELLLMAAEKEHRFVLESHRVPASYALGSSDGSLVAFPIVRPIELKSNNRLELERHIEALGDLFCGKLPVRRLWFRGQRQEYPLARNQALTQGLYGRPLPSLTPSLARYAHENPDKMNFGFAWAGPNRWWKKPFLIWLMQQNAHWFDYDHRFLPVLEKVLTDSDDQRFVELLVKIKMSPMEIGDPPHLIWPDEADDLEKWFFASMKRRQFAITLQQYGYHTSLLDITDDIDVALYFSQAKMSSGEMRCAPPLPGRVIYVFAESRGNFYEQGAGLFWGDEGWRRELPPRLERQKAGFMKGATNRNENFYGMMAIARISLGPDEPVTNLVDADLFPPESDDLLYAILRRSRPALEGLY